MVLGNLDLKFEPTHPSPLFFVSADSKGVRSQMLRNCGF